MVAPLVGIAAGLGIAGLQSLGGRVLGNRRQARTDAANREQLNLALQDDRLEPLQFKRVIAASEYDPGVGMDLYNAFKTGNEAEAARLEDEKFRGADLALRHQRHGLAVDQYNLDVREMIFDQQSTLQDKADVQRAFVDPQFAISQATPGQEFITQDMPGRGLMQVPIPGSAPYEEGTRLLTGQTAALERTNDLIDEVSQLRQLGPDPDAAEMARISSLRGQIVIDAKNLAELGALSGPDMGLVDQMLGGDPASFAALTKESPESIIAALSTYASAQSEALGNLQRLTPFQQQMRPELERDADLARARQGQRGAMVRQGIEAERAAAEEQQRRIDSPVLSGLTGDQQYQAALAMGFERAADLGSAGLVEIAPGIRDLGAAALGFLTRGAVGK